MVMVEPTTSGYEALPFDEVYRLYAADVYRFCLYQLREVSAAEDVSADVFLSAFKAYERAGVQPTSIRPWLIKIARNEVINHFRRHKRWRSVLSTLTGRGSEPQADPETVASINDELSTALTAIATLSARDRELVALRCGADLSFEEIGKVTGTSPHTARIATYRALNRLRSHPGFNSNG